MSTRHTILRRARACLRTSLIALSTVALAVGLSPVAYADGNGQISGTVTDTSSAIGVSDILVEAFSQPSDYQNNIEPVAETLTDTTGAYTLGDLPDGSYMVAFNDLRNGAYNPMYYQQFYNGAAWSDSELIQTVTVTAGQTVTGIDAHLTPLIPTTTTLTSSFNPSQTGQSVTYTATVSSNVGQGMMVFEDSGNLMFAENCAFTFFTGDTASCTVIYAEPGTHSITATYTGDNVYAPSSSAAVNQTVESYAPTSREQCKHGGWQHFTNPSFKNQGQCVSYVEHR